MTSKHALRNATFVLYLTSAFKKHMIRVKETEKNALTCDSLGD